MSYSLQLIRKAEQTTSDWSGGTTTQIAIYPPDAVYAERNFTWRISSARVDLPESTFTSLPGVWRLIMVLEGEMRLEHAGQHSCVLAPFEQDSFSGDWTTNSFGKVRDFNLMLANGSAGKLTALALAAQQTSSLELQHTEAAHLSQMTSAFYCVEGTATLCVAQQETYTLSAGDMLLITSRQLTGKLPVTITNTANACTQLVRSDIFYQ